jgi:hypothetical protein
MESLSPQKMLAKADPPRRVGIPVSRRDQRVHGMIQTGSHKFDIRPPIAVKEIFYINHIMKGLTDGRIFELF